MSPPPHAKALESAWRRAARWAGASGFSSQSSGAPGVSFGATATTGVGSPPLPSRGNTAGARGIVTGSHVKMKISQLQSRLHEHGPPQAAYADALHAGAGLDVDLLCPSQRDGTQKVEAVVAEEEEEEEESLSLLPARPSKGKRGPATGVSPSPVPNLRKAMATSMGMSAPRSMLRPEYGRVSGLSG